MAVAAVAWASVAAMQVPVNNPDRVEFTPSANHNDVTPDGKPVVVRYALQIYQTSNLDVSYRIMDLGKPAVQPDGYIRVTFSGLTEYPLPPGEYVARIVAWGQPGDGAGVSGLSNAFTFGGVLPPLPPYPPPMKPYGLSIK